MQSSNVQDPAAVIGASGGTSTWWLLLVMIGLAALDLVGAILAKEWTRGRGAWLFVAGVFSFVLLFVVYAIGLRYAELSTVTFGWIVGLQVSVLLVEAVHYGVRIPSTKWAAIAAILVLQAYLVLAPNEARSLHVVPSLDDVAPSELR